MKTFSSSLSGRLGLRRNLFFGFVALFGRGVGIFALNALVIWLFIHGIGDVVVVGPWPETSVPFFYFQFAMLIQSFFGFDPFAVEGHGSYGSELWVDILLWARLFFPFVVWGGAVKLLSSFSGEMSGNNGVRRAICVFAFLCASLVSIPFALNASFNGMPCFRSAIASGAYKLNDLGMRLDQLRLLPKQAPKEVRVGAS